MKFAKIFLPCLLLALVAFVSLVDVYDFGESNPLIPKQVKFKRPLKEYQIEGMQVLEMAAADETKPVILYLHGGGYRQGFQLFHWKMLADLSKATGCGLVMPDYPLLPEHTALEAHSLVLKLYSELLKRFPASKIIIMGDSAGGGFSLALAEEILEHSLPSPMHLILISPWVDITGGDESIADTTTGFILTNCINLVYLGLTAWMRTTRWFRHSTATCKGSRPPTFSSAPGKYSTPTSSIAVKK